MVPRSLPVGAAECCGEQPAGVSAACDRTRRSGRADRSDPDRRGPVGGLVDPRPDWISRRGGRRFSWPPCWRRRTRWSGRCCGCSRAGSGRWPRSCWGWSCRWFWSSSRCSWSRACRSRDLGTTVATLVIVAVVSAVTRWLVGRQRQLLPGGGPGAARAGEATHGRARRRPGRRPDRRGRGAGGRPALPAAAVTASSPGVLPTLARWVRSGSHDAARWWATGALHHPGEPGGPPARHQRGHPGLPLVREGHRAAVRGQPPRGRRRDRGAALRRAWAARRRRRQRVEHVPRRRPHARSWR